jgi:hypothetical protein
MNIRRNYVLMEEAGGGAAGGGAAGAGAGDAGAGAGAAAGGAAGAAATGAPGTGAAGVPWLAAGVDTDLIGHAQTKGWQTAVDAVKSHRELEKLLGADRAGRTVTIPTDENDKAGWEQVYNRLGRPATAEAYQLPVPQGGDPAFSRTAAAKFHELGISEKTGKALAEWWNGQAAAQAEAAGLMEQNALADEHKALEKDWGTGPDAVARKELARRAMLEVGKKAGLDQTKLQSTIDGLEKGVGFSGVLKIMATVGDMMKEHGAEGLGGPVGSFSTTPEGAKARRGQLMADKEWAKKAMDSKSAEWAELKRLDGIIASAMPQAA